MGADYLRSLPEAVLFRVVRGDEKGRAFGTPRNPRAPTMEEFKPRILCIRGYAMAAVIVARKHGLFPEQAESVSRLSDEELIRFRIEDPISATEIVGGLSLTGGHHRTNEIIQRIQTGRLAPDILIEILLHD